MSADNEAALKPPSGSFLVGLPSKFPLQTILPPTDNIQDPWNFKQPLGSRGLFHP